VVACLRCPWKEASKWAFIFWFGALWFSVVLSDDGKYAVISSISQWNKHITYTINQSKFIF